MTDSTSRIQNGTHMMVQAPSFNTTLHWYTRKRTHAQKHILWYTFEWYTHTAFPPRTHPPTLNSYRVCSTFLLPSYLILPSVEDRAEGAHTLAEDARVVEALIPLEQPHRLHVLVTQAPFAVEQIYILAHAIGLNGFWDDGGAALHGPSQHDLCARERGRGGRGGSVRGRERCGRALLMLLLLRCCFFCCSLLLHVCVYT